MNRRAPFHFAPAEKRRFEDTKAGNAALWLMVGTGVVICAIRFGLVALTGKAW